MKEVAGEEEEEEEGGNRINVCISMQEFVMAWIVFAIWLLLVEDDKNFVSVIREQAVNSIRAINNNCKQILITITPLVLIGIDCSSCSSIHEIETIPITNPKNVPKFQIISIYYI